MALSHEAVAKAFDANVISTRNGADVQAKSGKYLVAPIFFFYKNSSIKLSKKQEKQVQIRMWPYGRKQTHTPTQVMTPTSTPHVNR